MFSNRFSSVDYLHLWRLHEQRQSEQTVHDEYAETFATDRPHKRHRSGHLFARDVVVDTQLERAFDKHRRVSQECLEHEHGYGGGGDEDSDDLHNEKSWWEEDTPQDRSKERVTEAYERWQDAEEDTHALNSDVARQQSDQVRRKNSNAYARRRLVEAKQRATNSLDEVENFDLAREVERRRVQTEVDYVNRDQIPSYMSELTYHVNTLGNLQSHLGGNMRTAVHNMDYVLQSHAWKMESALNVAETKESLSITKHAVGIARQAAEEAHDAYLAELGKHVRDD